MSSLRADIVQYCQKTYGGVHPPDFPISELVARLLNPSAADRQEKWANELVSLEKNYRMLDYGFGIGNFILRMRERGYSIDGVEVDPALVDIAQRRAKEKKIAETGFMLSKDGKMPSEDNTYDLIFSYFVIEHVTNLFEYLSETHRVLKPGGRLLLATCNYLPGWEYHYCMWLPLFSKWLSKLILMLRRRNTSFFDELRFITPWKLRGCLNKLSAAGYYFSVNNVGKESFREELDSPKAHSQFFISLAKVAKVLGLIPVLEKLDLYNPLIYVLTKE